MPEIQQTRDGPDTVFATEAQLTDRISRIVRDNPNVVRLDNGRWGDITTYLPGRQVDGIRITPERVEIGIVARSTQPLPRLVAELRSEIDNALRDPERSSFPIDVDIVDVEFHGSSGQ